MKKILILVSIIIITICLFKSKTIIIPKEAIRFRVIANSNSKEDQNTKVKVVKNLKKDIEKIEIIPKNIELTRKNIQKNIPLIKNNIKKTLESINVKSDYQVEYGTNYFPEKKYKGIKYEEGEYESLVIKLGDGLGENFWCVLFPPLCLLEGEEQENSEIEYTSFIKELINKYF